MYLDLTAIHCPLSSPQILKEPKKAMSKKLKRSDDSSNVAVRSVVEVVSGMCVVMLSLYQFSLTLSVICTLARSTEHRRIHAPRMWYKKVGWAGKYCSAEPVPCFLDVCVLRRKSLPHPCHPVDPELFYD